MQSARPLAPPVAPRETLKDCSVQGRAGRDYASSAPVLLTGARCAPCAAFPGEEPCPDLPTGEEGNGGQGRGRRWGFLHKP